MFDAALIKPGLTTRLIYYWPELYSHTMYRKKRIQKTSNTTLECCCCVKTIQSRRVKKQLAMYTTDRNWRSWQSDVPAACSSRLMSRQWQTWVNC